MPKFRITFVPETAYGGEAVYEIEAESEEKAREIAEKMLETDAYEIQKAIVYDSDFVLQAKIKDIKKLKEVV